MGNRNIPQAGHTVLGATDKRLLVRQQRQTPHFIPMTTQHIGAVAAGEVPGTNRLICSARGQFTAIGPEHEGTHPSIMPL